MHDITALLIFLAIGALAGWLAGQIIKGGGFGIVGNIIVGVIGSILGGVLFKVLGITAFGLLGSIIMATMGAVILLFLIGLIKKA
ncbi:MAG TPA: GlsB/YeaQ/YmgE family stress response membrane protein [Candidatus Competibacter sp.]|nr:GlsB/YeaQ/YmgE family stress response membrane protein [Candidatus Competibacter sp.]